MQIYQVGGAVRDLLLGIEPKDRDWVVVGAEQDELITKGYKKVGRAFPVFLHPKTKEEYALARSEKKKGSGHQGFDINFHAKITLEEDLARRDFTVNAIALDENGKFIDPFGGIGDLKKRVLRHVTDAFAEDPLRVLRAARFAAKLEFKIATDTMKLLSKIVDSGELCTLSEERIQRELILSLQTKAPNNFFKTLYDCNALSKLLPECNLSQLTDPECEVYKYFKKLNNALENDYLILMAIYVSKEGKNKSTSNFPKLVRRLKFSKIIQEQISITSENWEEIANVSKASTDSVLSLLKKTDAYRRIKRFKQILTSMEAMTSEYGVVLIKSLALLNHIIDNPVSIEDALKTKEYDNGKVADEIKKALDKKRKEQINEARTLYLISK